MIPIKTAWSKKGKRVRSNQEKNAKNTVAGKGIIKKKNVVISNVIDTDRC